VTPGRVRPRPGPLAFTSLLSESSACCCMSATRSMAMPWMSSVSIQEPLRLVFQLTSPSGDTEKLSWRCAIQRRVFVPVPSSITEI
jgi:hypothetical protein